MFRSLFHLKAFFFHLGFPYSFACYHGVRENPLYNRMKTFIEDIGVVEMKR